MGEEVTMREAMDMLNLTDCRIVHKLIKQGEIDAKRDNRFKLWIIKEDVVSYMKKQDNQ